MQNDPVLGQEGLRKAGGVEQLTPGPLTRLQPAVHMLQVLPVTRSRTGSGCMALDLIRHNGHERCSKPRLVHATMTLFNVVILLTRDVASSTRSAVWADWARLWGG